MVCSFISFATVLNDPIRQALHAKTALCRHALYDGQFSQPHRASLLAFLPIHPDISCAPDFGAYKERTGRHLATGKLEVQFLPVGFLLKLKSEFVWAGQGVKETYKWVYELDEMGRWRSRYNRTSIIQPIREWDIQRTKHPLSREY